MKKEYKRICNFCGTEFIANDARKVFCSKRCKDISSRVSRGIKCNTSVEPYKKTCVVCGNEFETFRYDVKTCSTDCAQKRRGEINENTNKQEKRVIADRIGGEFDFVSYENRKIKIKCKKCGFVSEKCRQTIYRHNQRCDNCNKIEQEKKRLEELRKELCNVLSLYTEFKKDKVCSGCGTVFHSEVESKKYCCEKCKKKAHKKGNYRQRARHYGVEYDSTITLAKIYKRDGGICQICGKPTDWKSNEWNGTLGANYPTVDHIKALANGGSHTWDNVQLAHAFCNSCKRDLM